ncbi:hypothetical protein INR49_024276 [Caranx melampygus]|nr:hypothetical protein INR49_024276 [Caranx melampygus]
MPVCLVSRLSHALMICLIRVCLRPLLLFLAFRSRLSTIHGPLFVCFWKPVIIRRSVKRHLTTSWSSFCCTVSIHQLTVYVTGNGPQERQNNRKRNQE